MWRLHPQVVSLDNTYKTNRFKMPFLNVTGVTNTHSTFNIAFGVINKEDEPAYTWAVERLEDLRTKIGADYPYVVVTDSEKALKNALDNVWEDVQQQICLWHVNKNVIFEVKKRWAWAAGQQPPEGVEEVDETDDHVDPIFRDLVAAARREDHCVTLDSLPTKVEDSPTGFLELWKHLCYAATPDDFVAAWVKILEDFSQQEAIISYLQTTYLPFRHQWATCFTRQYRIFGVQVTSRTEASHKEIKSYLRNTFADLLFLAQRIKQLVTDCERAFKAREAEEAVRMVRDHQKHLWLGNMRAKLSRKAVSLVIQQREIVIKALKSNPGDANPLRPCTRQFSKQFGLPCSHKIHELLLQNQALDFTMADPNWHLTRDRVRYRLHPPQILLLTPM